MSNVQLRLSDSTPLVKRRQWSRVEAETTNSAIGGSVVDGLTIEWERFKKFEGMSQEEIDVLGVKEYEKLEDERMKKNALHVSKLLVEQIELLFLVSE